MLGLTLSGWEAKKRRSFLREGGKAQAQLVINVHPSQSNNNQTLWIFSGSSIANIGSSVQTSAGSNNLGYGDT